MNVAEDENTTLGIGVNFYDAPEILSYGKLHENQVQTALGVLGIFSKTALVLVFTCSKNIRKTYFNMLVRNQVSRNICQQGMLILRVERQNLEIT